MAAKKELTPKEIRLQIASDRVKKESLPKESDIRKEFKIYFAKLKRKMNFDPSLESILWLHLKSIGNDKPELFEKGIKHFGYDI